MPNKSAPLRRGLNEEELALFDLFQNGDLSKAERERVKQASRSLLSALKGLLAPLERWTEKAQTQAEVETFVLDNIFRDLPTPPFTEEQKEEAAGRVYQYIWRQSASGYFGLDAV